MLVKRIIVWRIVQLERGKTGKSDHSIIFIKSSNTIEHINFMHLINETYQIKFEG